MGYFDLNIPYYESDKHITDKSTKKTCRLKLVVKSMELGYSGVAYNRTMKGVMSESERCDISHFPLSSILKLAPSISASVKFRRELLGVPTSTPFRQYTRLTVIVDSPSQASALNSGNPILKSYDIVAVRPLNQNAFEQACQTSEVDLIAIDFSEKLPFRLKQSIVKAAIERGVYFEIMYANLLMDPQVRRQLITNAKLLVDWTRGKNLIFSSAAPSVTELRGPNDVANLSSLLGLSMERAKASISKNCRSLIANALRKKYFYKDAIRVEVIPSGKQFDSVGSGINDWLKWDPLSSGEGDLQLDDIEKAFNDSNKASNTVKAIDFASVVDGLLPNGLQIKDLISTTKTAMEPPDISKNLSKILEKDSRILFSSPEKIWTNPDVVGDRTPTIDKEPEISNGSDIETEAHDLKSRICVTNYETDLVVEDDNETDTEIARVPMQSEEIDSSAFVHEESNSAEIPAPCSDVIMEHKESKRSCLDAVLGPQNDAVDEVLLESGMKGKLDVSSAKLHEDFTEYPFPESFGAMKSETNSSVANSEPTEEVAVENKMRINKDTVMNSPTSHAPFSGKARGKRRTSHGVSLFPFKRLLSPAPLKKKARKVKRKL